MTSLRPTLHIHVDQSPAIANLPPLSPPAPCAPSPTSPKPSSHPALPPLSSPPLPRRPLNTLHTAPFSNASRFPRRSPPPPGSCHNPDTPLHLVSPFHLPSDPSKSPDDSWRAATLSLFSKAPLPAPDALNLCSAPHRVIAYQAFARVFFRSLVDRAFPSSASSASSASRHVLHLADWLSRAYPRFPLLHSDEIGDRFRVFATLSLAVSQTSPLALRPPDTQRVFAALSLAPLPDLVRLALVDVPDAFVRVLLAPKAASTTRSPSPSTLTERDLLLSPDEEKAPLPRLSVASLYAHIDALPARPLRARQVAPTTVTLFAFSDVFELLEAAAKAHTTRSSFYAFVIEHLIALDAAAESVCDAHSKLQTLSSLTARLVAEHPPSALILGPLYEAFTDYLIQSSPDMDAILPPSSHSSHSGSKLYPPSPQYKHSTPNSATSARTPGGSATTPSAVFGEHNQSTNMRRPIDAPVSIVRKPKDHDTFVRKRRTSRFSGVTLLHSPTHSDSGMDSPPRHKRGRSFSLDFEIADDLQESSQVYRRDSLGNMVPALVSPRSSGASASPRLPARSRKSISLGPDPPGAVRRHSTFTLPSSHSSRAATGAAALLVSMHRKSRATAAFQHLKLALHEALAKARTTNITWNHRRRSAFADDVEPAARKPTASRHTSYRPPLWSIESVDVVVERAKELQAQRLVEIRRATSDRTARATPVSDVPEEEVLLEPVHHSRAISASSADVSRLNTLDRLPSLPGSMGSANSNRPRKDPLPQPLPASSRPQLEAVASEFGLSLHKVKPNAHYDPSRYAHLPPDTLIALTTDIWLQADPRPDRLVRQHSIDDVADDASPSSAEAKEAPTSADRFGKEAALGITPDALPGTDATPKPRPNSTENARLRARESSIGLGNGNGDGDGDDPHAEWWEPDKGLLSQSISVPDLAHGGGAADTQEHAEVLTSVAAGSLRLTTTALEWSLDLGVDLDRSAAPSRVPSSVASGASFTPTPPKGEPPQRRFHRHKQNTGRLNGGGEEDYGIVLPNQVAEERSKSADPSSRDEDADALKVSPLRSLSGGDTFKMHATKNKSGNNLMRSISHQPSSTALQPQPPKQQKKKKKFKAPKKKPKKKKPVKSPHSVHAGVPLRLSSASPQPDTTVSRTNTFGSQTTSASPHASSGDGSAARSDGSGDVSAIPITGGSVKATLSVLQRMQNEQRVSDARAVSRESLIVIRLAGIDRFTWGVMSSAADLGSAPVGVGTIFSNPSRALSRNSTRPATRKGTLRTDTEGPALQAATGEGVLHTTPDLCYLSVHYANQAFKFFPLLESEARELSAALTHLTGMQPFDKQLLATRLAQRSVKHKRLEVLGALLREPAPWIDHSKPLTDLVHFMVLNPDGLKLVHMERLYHSCRLNRAVTSETVSLLETMWEESEKQVHRLRILTILERLVDRAVMSVSDGVFRRIVAWLRQLESMLDPYQQPQQMKMVTGIQRQAARVKQTKLVPLNSGSAHKVFQNLEEFKSWQRMFVQALPSTW